MSEDPHPPSVVGIVIRANTSGTTIPPRVANMNTSTRSATGTAIDSPRARSWLYNGLVSWLIAGKPVRYVRARDRADRLLHCRRSVGRLGVLERRLELDVHHPGRRWEYGPRFAVGEYRGATLGRASTATRLSRPPVDRATSVKAPSLRSWRCERRMFRPR